MSQLSVMESARASFGTEAGRKLFSSWAKSIETWLIRRQGWQDLSSLDDHLLADIGISREDALPRKPFGAVSILKPTGFLLPRNSRDSIGPGGHEKF
jgi:uncharacterized protein YjiS (DUF1127 family)